VFDEINGIKTNDWTPNCRTPISKLLDRKLQTKRKPRPQVNDTNTPPIMQRKQQKPSPAPLLVSIVETKAKACRARKTPGMVTKERNPNMMEEKNKTTPECNRRFLLNGSNKVAGVFQRQFYHQRNHCE
jgi:hypothetical protein